MSQHVLPLPVLKPQSKPLVPVVTGTTVTDSVPAVGVTNYPRPVVESVPAVGVTHYTLSDTDTTFMRAYASAIKNKFQLDVGDRYSMLISPVTQRGIAAGNLIPPEITNYLVYKLADSLQYSNNPSYTGGSAGSYIEQMRSYIDWVDLQHQVSAQNIDVLKPLNEALKLASDKYWDLVQTGSELYEKVKHLYPGLDFWQWAKLAYPLLEAANAAMKIATTEVYQAMQRFYGPNYAALSTYMNNLTSAKSPYDLPGYNQAAVADDVLIEAAISAANSGDPMANNNFADSIIRVPTYSMASYSNTVQGWIDAAKAGATRDVVITVDSDKGENTSWEEFGFPEVDPTLHGRAAVWSLFSAQVYNDKGELEPRRLDTRGLTETMSLRISMVGIAKFDILSGEWDLPDIKTLFPNRLPNAPDILDPKLARMVSLLVGYDVELRVKFSSALRGPQEGPDWSTQKVNQVDQIIKDVQENGGSLSVFGFRVPVQGTNDKSPEGAPGIPSAPGIPVKLPGSRPPGNSDGGASGRATLGSPLQRVDTKFENVNWSKEDGELVLTPTKGQVYPTILGAVAQRFQ
ncbi:hypothetical protein D9757_014569 [Collybiopsis confluens]|uniref:Uncharacterized protein n=1 Tax=Collybiopsis confluens TaxID=2823264 RepID=A0A8H5CF60_9AGAR|nr:hypothetical protein D9757_014569 [Collybiopsis confluens]